MATSTVSFTLDSDLLSQLVTAACATYGYQPALPDGTVNTTSPSQFTTNCVISFCKSVVRDYQARVAAEQARQAALAAAAQALDTAQIEVSVS